MTFQDSIQKILDLGVCSIIQCISGRPDSEIREIRLLDGGAPDFRPDLLYIGRPEQLPDGHAPDNCVNLICCGSAPVPVRFFGCIGLNLLLLENPDTAILIYNRVFCHTAEKPAVAAGMLKMARALMRGNGLQYLADVASEVIGNPIRISDLNYNYITKYNAFSSNDPIVLEAQEGRTTNDHVGVVTRNRVRERPKDIWYPVFSPLPDSDKPGQAAYQGTGIVSTVAAIQGVVVAFPGLYDINHPHRPEDYELLDFFSKLVALELQKDSYYAMNKGLRYSHLLHDLLTDRLSAPGNTRDRLAALGYTLHENLYILAVDLLRLHSDSYNPHAIIDYLHHLIPSSIYTLYQDTAVFLINRDNAHMLQASELDTLQKYFSDMGLKAGLSARFGDIHSISQNYDNACKAVELGACLHPDRSLFLYPDYVLYHMLDVCGGRVDFSQLAGGALQKLAAYERAWDTPLLETLRCYLKHGGRSQYVTTELGIHKNTLLYRIERIQEITGLPLDKGETRMELLLAFRVQDFQKALGR